MKRKIIVGLGIYSLVLLIGAYSILRTVHEETTRLDNLIMLHQVEILREHYLIQIKRVQTDLALEGSVHARSFETVVAHARNMGMVITTCFDCHHAPPVAERIMDLKLQTDLYQEGLSRVLTIRANAVRLAEERDAAFRAGEFLIQQVSQMIAMTGARLERYTQAALREIQRTKYVLYTLVGLGPLLSAGLALVLITGFTKPVKALLESTRKLKTGDLDHRVTGLRDEFGELGDSFNDMAASLKEHMQRMQHAEQMAVVGKLSAGLAHEIKNPLAGIKAAMHVLSREASLAEEDRGVLRKVSEEITRLEGLMKSFLNFAKPPKPQPAQIEINTLMNTTLAFHGTGPRNAEGRDTVNIVREFGTIPSTLADPMQLQQVFLNLVINAMDAMPAGGTLTVRTGFEPKEAMLRVEVADTGKGIDPENAEKIFQPFFTTKHGGTGLGLAICRQLLEQDGGTIAAAPNPGGGAVFTVRIPVRSVAQGAAA